MENNSNYINIYLFDRTVDRMVDRTADRQMIRQTDRQIDHTDRFHTGSTSARNLTLFCCSSNVR